MGLPSFFEGLPLALQEAMHCGCACLATDIPGNDELILDGENGLLTTKGNADAMAAGLERLISDETLRESFRILGPSSVLKKGMSLEQMIQRHLEIYESFV